MAGHIKNFEELAMTPNRRLALSIAEAAIESIKSEDAVFSSVRLEGNILNVQGENYDLSKFKKIKIVGFGKASSAAASSLEQILGSKIDGGAVIDLNTLNLERIETFAGTHPLPSQKNIDAGEKIFEIIKNSGAEDLVIAIVSGGGSALLCYSQDECGQGIDFYNQSLEHGLRINEMNTIRKHLSVLKGGGLAKIAYPATVIGLVFSDIPGDDFADVASGPTYKDKSTVADAKEIIKKYSLGDFNLMETPKEDMYFEKVRNYILVSNKTAVEAMDRKSKELGLRTVIVSTELYDETKGALAKIFKESSDNTVVLAAGEPKLVVSKKGGTGGRSLYMGLEAIQMGLVKENSVFIPLASDGVDNSDAAGAIVDKNTIEKIKQKGINVEEHLNNFNAYPVFKNSGDMIMTGPTGANVSDLMILLTKAEK